MPVGTPVRVPPPPGALLLDPLATDQGGLLPTGINFITRYGAFELRPGLTQLGQTLTTAEPVMGHFWTRDQSEAIRLVVGTTRRWWAYDNSTRLWSDLSTSGPGPVLTGVNTQPSVFTYWEEGNNQYIIGVNDRDIATEWQIGSAGYAAMTSYIAKTVCTVANRLLYGNVTIGGTRFPTMVAWSSVGTRATNPATARAKLLDSGDAIVCVRRMGRLSAVIYREQSQWLATAQAGSDAQAFQFTVQDYQPGPIGPAALTTGPGLRHTYMGLDLNLYTFDGVQAVMLCPTAGILEGRFNASVARQLTSVQYVPARQETWVFLALDSDTVPTHGLVYSYQTGGAFLVQMTTGKEIYMLGTWQVELETPTDLLPDIPTDTLPDVPTDQLGLKQGQSILIAGVSDRVYMVDGPSDDGVEISGSAEYLLPVLPGQEHAFNGVEIMCNQADIDLTITAQYGPDMNNLRAVVLGIINPSITPPTMPAPLSDVASGPNLTTIRAQTSNELLVQGKIVVLAFACHPTSLFKIQRIELQTYPRQAVVAGTT